MSIYTALALVIILGMLAVWLVRKYLFDWMKNDEGTAGAGFSLSDLRQLHKAGKMTDEEFEKAKAQVVAGIQKAQAAQAARPASAKAQDDKGTRGS